MAVWYFRNSSNFAWDTESPSMLTSKRCAGSSGRLVAGSTGRLTLLYSDSWTAVTTSKLHLRCFFSLLNCQQRFTQQWPTENEDAYSRVRGQSRAALRIYSGPRMNLFHRLIAFR